MINKIIVKINRRLDFQFMGHDSTTDAILTVNGEKHFLNEMDTERESTENHGARDKNTKTQRYTMKIV